MMHVHGTIAFRAATGCIPVPTSSGHRPKAAAGSFRPRRASSICASDPGPAARGAPTTSTTTTEGQLPQPPAPQQKQQQQQQLRRRPEEQDEAGDGRQRDLFVPVMVAVALAGYALTALLAVLEQ
ncbi:hypothetical protein Agub_g6353 [Astrephomene gubernaculifera]|uniref:Uncharacterized protein n=1 Tax=Astrephomene gubernaculifera TaxID=47775 RepID=A0AAD3HLL8_9CHLO|nr:hypothetical protein Agub_g6353 [Astrephomene gubernaculifera]